MAQWVLHHAPSLTGGGLSQVVGLAVAFAKAANATVREAVLSGGLPVRSAAVVVAEADRLRPLLAPGAEAPVLEGLMSMAREHGPRGARMVRPRLLAQYGLEGQLQAEQDAARRFVALSQPMDAGAGVFEYRLALDTEGKAVLEAALGPLSAPRPAEGERDLRPAEQRRGDALVELVRRAVGSGESVPTTAKAQLFVTVDYDTLTGRLAAQARTARPGDDTPEGQDRAAHLAAGTVTGSADAGTLLAPETVRRIACDAALIPAVLGTGGEVLDWGRERRLFTPAQVKRLWLRDGGCTYPGCGTPAQWCDAHHLTHWADGGPTSLANAALVCGRHHTVVHQRRLAGHVRPGPEEVPVQWDLQRGSYDAHLAERDHRRRA